MACGPSSSQIPGEPHARSYRARRGGGLHRAVPACRAGACRQGPQAAERPARPTAVLSVQDMDPSDLKTRLEACAEGKGGKGRFSDHKQEFEPTDFSIGHRGAGLQFPEHTEESYEAAAAHGCRHRRVRRDLHQGPRAGLPPRPVRPAHHHQHPGGARAGRQVHRAVHAGRPGLRHAGIGEMLHQRSHARRVQEPPGQDGRVPTPTPPRSRRTWPARRPGAPTCTRPAR